MSSLIMINRVACLEQQQNTTKTSYSACTQN